MRALLPLLHANAPVVVKTAELDLSRQGDPPAELEADAFVKAAAEKLAHRRSLGSVTGYFPTLWVDGTPIHESLAINEWTAETYPNAKLWPQDTLKRAQTRSLCAEMASNFSNLRNHMSCHVFARVPNFQPDGPTRVEIARVFELFNDCLSASGGPFLFGDFGIVDAMYFPVLTRFATYNVALPSDMQRYQASLNDLPAVQRWLDLAKQAPAIPVYDEFIRAMGGEIAIPA